MSNSLPPTSLSEPSPPVVDPLPQVPTVPRRPKAARRSRRLRWIALALLLAVGGVSAYVFTRPTTAKRPDLIAYKVKLEPLPISVVAKGTLESVDNRDIICRVKAGSKGTYSSTIKWAIDDGANVTKGQLVIELDDSALQETKKQQSIVVDKAKAEWIKAEKELAIQVMENKATVAQAIASMKIAELELDKFTGFRAEPALNPFGAVFGAQSTVMEKGEYKQKLDDVSGRLKQAESDLEAYRERSAWAERSVKLGYLTPSQSKVEQTKLSGANDNLEKLSKERFILENFTREKEFTDLRSKLEVAKIGSEKAAEQAEAKFVQAESEERTKASVYLREKERLEEIDEQIDLCKMYAPQSGMVVYYKAEASRSSSSQQLIAVGEQVREGQKLMRIPDLSRMQVNTRVHEAQVGRIHGDVRESLHLYDSTRLAMLMNINPFARLMSQDESFLGHVQDLVKDKEYRVTREGDPATIRVDAFPGRTFSGRVKLVAAVAAQADWFSSDVKVYSTQVLINETADGLKPDMNAEVTIHIDNSTTPVLVVPIQAIVGGPEYGPKRFVYVLTPSGPVEREVQLGKFNDAKIEVLSGVSEGEDVVTNPKAIVGDKMKTREDTGNGRSNGGAPGGGMEKKGGGKKGGGGAGGPPGVGSGGPPPGVGGGMKKPST